MFRWLGTKKQTRTYLDWAAATPVAPAVRNAMAPYFADQYGNPSALHAEGRAARAAVEAAREQVARTLRVRADEIVFVSGGTESNNLAILGALRALHTRGVPYADMEVVSTPIEHPATAAALSELTRWGVTIKTCAVDESGRIDTASLHACLSARTRLVTCAYVNSEIGVVQDVKRLARLARRVVGEQVRVHIDAAQAPLWLPCDIERLGVDLVSLDAAKFCGPKGSGVLVVRRATQLRPLFFGGGQEAGRRPGTENTPLVVGCAAALATAQADCVERAAAVEAVRDYARKQVREVCPTAYINGSWEFRVANNLNFSLPGVDTEYLTIVLDHHGIAVSTKSACSGAGSGASGVVYALTNDSARASATVRLTLGPDTTNRDIDHVMTCIQNHVAAQAALTNT